MIVSIYTGIGLLFAYMIPTFAIKSQKSDQRTQFISRVISVCLFLIFGMLAWMKWRGNAEYFLALFCLFILLLISITDHWFGLIPNLFTYPAIGVVLVIRLFIHFPSPFGYYVAMVIGGFSLFLLAYLTRGMGIGDAKLFALGGLIVGWPNIWLSLWFATISAICYLVFRWIIRNPISRGTPFPFGPHLALGIYMTYLYGDEFIQLILQSWFYPF